MAGFYSIFVLIRARTVYYGYFPMKSYNFHFQQTEETKQRADFENLF